MPLLSISDLLSVTTQSSALNLELTIAAALGLPTTAWQALSPEMVILGVNAQLVATYSGDINRIAAGGFVTTAATIIISGSTTVDSQGFDTRWMDLVSANVFNVSRVPATFANGNVPVNNGGTPYPITVGQLHFQHPVTGATYSNTTATTIPANASSFAVPIQADGPFPGSKGTAAQGTTLIMLTPLSGVVPQALTTPMIGADLETNAALLLRDQAKLGSLSPNGAAAAYQFVATSIPTAATQSVATFPFNVLPYTVTSPITRVATLVNVLTGTVQVFVADSAGAPPGGDVTTVGTAIQALCTPLSVTSSVQAVGTVPLNLVFSIWVLASSGLTKTQVLASIDAAIATFCSQVPIGGYSTKAANIVPHEDLVDVIMNANKGSIDIQLTNPSGDVAIGATSVPVPGAPTLTNPNCIVYFV